MYGTRFTPIQVTCSKCEESVNLSAPMNSNYNSGRNESIIDSFVLLSSASRNNGGGGFHQPNSHYHNINSPSIGGGGSGGMMTTMDEDGNSYKRKTSIATMLHTLMRHVDEDGDANDDNDDGMDSDEFDYYLNDRTYYHRHNNNKKHRNMSSEYDDESYDDSSFDERDGEDGDDDDEDDAWSKIDQSLMHPLCTTCINQLMRCLDEEVEQLQSENFMYDRRLAQFQDDPQCVSLSELQRNAKVEEERERQYLQQLDQLLKEEKSLRDTLAIQTAERQRIMKEHNSLMNTCAQLDRSQGKYWGWFFSQIRFYSECIDDAESAHNLSSFIESEYKRLQQRVSLPLMFDIWFDGEFGTINGLRLGRLDPKSMVRVEWEEVNAALGHCCLLLSLIAQKRKFSFGTYRLVPSASTSKIIETEYGKQHDLYYTLPRNLLSFNQAIRCFLACVHEMCLFVESQSTRVASNRTNNLQRYPMNDEDGTIRGLKLEYSVEDEAKWTKALQSLLINIKFLQRAK